MTKYGKFPKTPRIGGRQPWNRSYGSPPQCYSPRWHLPCTLGPPLGCPLRALLPASQPNSLTLLEAPWSSPSQADKSRGRRRHRRHKEERRHIRWLRVKDIQKHQTLVWECSLIAVTAGTMAHHQDDYCSPVAQRAQQEVGQSMWNWGGRAVGRPCFGQYTDPSTPELLWPFPGATLCSCQYPREGPPLFDTSGDGYHPAVLAYATRSCSPISVTSHNPKSTKHSMRKSKTSQIECPQDKQYRNPAASTWPKCTWRDTDPEARWPWK